MPKKIFDRWHGLYTLLNILFSALLVIVLFLFQWVLGALAFFVLLGLIYFTYKDERKFDKELNQYISTISYKVKKAGTEAFQQLPIGIILYDEEKKIEWHNPYLQSIVGKDDPLIGLEIIEIFPKLVYKEGVETIEFEHNEKIYEVEAYLDERLLYIREITKYKRLLNQFNNNKPVFGIIHLDNLDEVAQGLNELDRSLLISEVTSAINDWANNLEIYLKRYTADKFFMVTDQAVLEHLEKTRFDILDVVREMTADNKIPITLSIGVGAGAKSLLELGEITQSSLDIALGRGGDQAAVKAGDRLTFYGGKSNAVEKRTRVRARVISHALRDLIKESDLVIIMGHKTPDMDAIGASMGVLKAVQINNKSGYIVLDESNPSIERLITEVNKNEELAKYFISPEKASSLITSKTILVMIDTHKPSLTIAPQLIDEVERVVIIDHHRRGEEIVADPVLIYIEPYASSTSELVTELLQYQGDQFNMEAIEATALLAGMVVDTKGFAFRTGSRTFDAAAFLRRKGADPALVQKLLKEDIDQFIQRAELVKKARIMYDHIAIAVAEEKLGQLLIAQAADTLLNMSGIFASFVISVRTDGVVAISARSLGQINVQIIMERLGGGGHLTNAAAQLKDTTVEEVEAKLIEVLQGIREEGGLMI